MDDNHRLGPKQFPKPPEPAKKPELTEDEVSFILRSTLTPKHFDDPNVLAFINAYLMTRDVKESSKLAGISTMSGRALRNRKDIHEAILKITQQSALKYGFDAEEIVANVRAMATVDPADFIDKETGAAIMNLHDVPSEARKALKKFKVKNLYENDPNGIPVLIGHLVEFEFWDKTRNNELLGREKQIFKETKRVEHDVAKNMKDFLLGSLERADKRILEARQVSEVAQVTQIEGVVDAQGSEITQSSDEGPGSDAEGERGV